MLNNAAPNNERTADALVAGFGKAPATVTALDEGGTDDIVIFSSRFEPGAGSG
jgi:hypothetical protein